MSFPRTFDEMKTQGYRFDNHSECKGCGDEIEWWNTPNGKKIPMNLMQRGSDAAVAHWSTCSEQDSFRSKR